MEFVSYDIESNDFRRAGAASRAIKEHLQRIGADAGVIRRVMIAAYEAEMNVVIHSVGGRLEASLSDSRIDVNVVDNGPGIPDIELAMREGYSTAGAEARAMGFGAGMGLPNIKRSSDRLRVTSRVGEGTRVSFTINLKLNLRPEVTHAARAVSLYASADRCRDCRACLAACPTQALRVRDGRPMVLEHLCIECTQCIGACTSRALTIRDVLPSLDDVTVRTEAALVVPPALLAGFGPGYPPVRVLAAAKHLGFVGARTVSPFEEAVRQAALETAPQSGGSPVSDADNRGPTDDAAAPRPVILPMCPAVVNLVELKFPSLVGALGAIASPWEMVEAGSAGERLACVVSCPSQRSVLSVGEAARGDAACDAAPIECLLPEALRGPLMKELTGMGAAALGPEAAATPDRAAMDDGLLVVSGIRHVMAVLEEMENGLLEDVTALEAYACEGGCFGSPLVFEDHHVSRRRWARGKAAAEAADGAVMAEEASLAAAADAPPVRAHRRRYAARPGIRLDADMAKAIQKLGRLQTTTHSLPGRDCGACGAPTCAALAEDVVMDRAGIELCPYIAVKEEVAE
jgi:anti-sigma regulatory factor (Ser/Thr protein kinase)/Na+-translocating ferredoxin:NAD+ oxidoreductase RNF subunit RnfB